MTSVTTPAPTVRPPSLIANLSSFSIAIGEISSTRHADVVSRHDHLHTLRQLCHSRYVRCPEVELRPIAFEKRRVSAAFFLGQYICLRLELGVRCDAPRLCQYLTPLYIIFADAPQQCSDVVACPAFIKKFPEHLHAGDYGLPGCSKPYDFYFFAYLDDTSFHSARHYGATA